ncbi:hypothetical protein AJ78_08047 [Emergomyces pasteurianus Ep9510]|uniref:F-box domain-containing protein n=1 Tax=Emergomyces pasteurianus Ep9510 TaxID=1447872 RepID=A0A1J9P2X0_9EURO|nr:hypothetical protein AJ78_08047 [Emergomyces pasteurianus Ep9510]
MATKGNPPSRNEEEACRKFNLRLFSSKICRSLRIKYRMPRDRSAHGPRSTCSLCKYSPFDAAKYCPNMYRRCITPGEVENSKKSILHRLPPEMIFLVMKHLKPFEVECLRYVCRLFYHNYPSSRFLTSQGKFELQCLMEREPGSKTLACKECCNRRHNKSMFYPIDWNRNPHHRKCKKYRGGLLQLCPYRSASFADMVNLSKGNFRSFQVPKCSHDAFDLALALQGRFYSLEDETWTIIHQGKNNVLSTTVLVAIYHAAKIPSSADVEKACKALDMPLCPHVHLGDLWVTNQYMPGLVALHLYQVSPLGDCSCLHCRGFMCLFCDSRFKFRVFARKEPVASTCVGVSVMRNLGELKDPDDPLWLTQLSIPKLPDFRTVWSDSITAMYLNCATGVPQDSPESNAVSRLWENKAKCVLNERDGWTTTPLGNSRGKTETLHKPLWKPPLRRQHKKYWRWEAYSSDGFLTDEKPMSKSDPRKSLH